MTLDTCVSNFDTQLVVAAAPGGVCPRDQAAFTGVCIAANDDACGVGSRVSFPVTAGSTFVAMVGAVRALYACVSVARASVASHRPPPPSVSLPSPCR